MYIASVCFIRLLWRVTKKETSENLYLPWKQGMVRVLPIDVVLNNKKKSYIVGSIYTGIFFRFNSSYPIPGRAVFFHQFILMTHL